MKEETQEQTLDYQTGKALEDVMLIILEIKQQDIQRARTTKHLGEAVTAFVKLVEEKLKCQV